VVLLEEIMITQSSRRRSGWWGRSLFVLLALILATGASAGTKEEFIPTSPSNMLAMEEYYDFENPNDAASALRRDAVRFGLDVEEHPPAGNANHPYSVLNLHVAKIKPDFEDRAYLSALESMSTTAAESDEVVAILAVHRELSIDEVAGIFESGIRILEKLSAGSRHEIFGGYIVQGPAAALVELQDRDYFSWLGEYRADLKRQADLGPSSIDMYVIKLYKKRIKPTHVADIESLGATIMFQSELFRGIQVKCSWDIALKLCELDWVRSIYSEEPPADSNVR